MTIEPGFIEIGNQDYHDGEGLSSSGIKKILVSPADFKVPNVRTDTMAFGSMVHAYILEPEVFNSQYVMAPPGYKGTTTVGKLFKAESEAAGKEIIKPSDFDIIKNIKDALLNNRTASHLLWGTEGVNEIAGYWNDPVTGVLCKLKPDRRVDSKRYIIDLKTCNNANEDEFNNSIYNFEYYISAAHYLNGMKVLTSGEDWEKFICIAVEKTPPFKVKSYILSDIWLYLGREKCKEAIMKYAECIATDNWPKFEDKAVTLTPKKWMMDKIIPYQQ